MSEENWRAGLPEELRNDEALTSFETPEALASAYLESQKPSDWRTGLPEEMQNSLKDYESLESAITAYSNRVDAPEIPKEYTLPEGVQLNGFNDFARENQLTQSQVDSLIKYQNDMQSQFQTQFEETQTKELNTLLDSWGDKRDSNLAQAQQALRHFDADGEVTKFLEATQAGNNAKVVAFLYRVGEALKEDGHITGVIPTKSKSKDAANVLYPNQI